MNAHPPSFFVCLSRKILVNYNGNIFAALNKVGGINVEANILRLCLNVNDDLAAFLNVDSICGIERVALSIKEEYVILSAAADLIKFKLISSYVRAVKLNDVVTVGSSLKGIGERRKLRDLSVFFNGKLGVLNE